MAYHLYCVFFIIEFLYVLCNLTPSCIPRLIEVQRLGIFFIVVLTITVFQSRYRQICSLLFYGGLGDSSSMNKPL